MDGTPKQEPKPSLPPPAVGRIVDRIRALLIGLYRQLAPPPAVMLDMITASWVTQALHVAARLGVADQLVQGPLSADELARKVGANPQALQRVMRALVGNGVFTENGGRYELNRLAQMLRSDSAYSMRRFAMFIGGKSHWHHWAHLLDSVKSGDISIPQIRGMPFFDYLEHDKELAEDFHGAMRSVSDLARDPVLAVYDFSRFKTLVDVGGGHGKMLAAILEKHTNLQGVLYDLPSVVAGAPVVMKASGVERRCTIVEGSFFDRVPPGFDGYMMKHIIHDWAEDKCLTILGNIRKVIHASGTLLLMELVLPEDNRAHPGKVVDLEMLLSVGGRERTPDEYAALLAKAGFKMTRVVPTVGPLSIVEAVPA